MDPVPEESRTWSTWDYITYWISDAANAATWQMASSMLAVGLSWSQALAAIAVGNSIIAVRSFLTIQSVLCDSTNQVGGHGIEWNRWCSITHFFSCHEPFFFWVLAELF